jgi:CMP/dCMP kinase
MRKRPIITVDGPSGAGKSTVARRLAGTLGYGYMDTGAMYRGVAFAYLSRGQDVPVENFLQNLSLRFDFGIETKVFLDGEEISHKIRDSRVSKLASDLSQDGRIRAYLTTLQREIGRSGGIVLEGRDTGSVVFPDAEIKFYIDAGLEERGRRRYRELVDRGTPEELSDIIEAMAERDRNDAMREVAPLVIPPGAISIDTTGIDIDGVVAILLGHVRILIGGD